MLQNRTYLGYIKYHPYTRNSDGSRSYSAEIQWFEGKHQGIISQELFDQCQEIRGTKSSFSVFHPKLRHYLLRNLIFCAECASHMPEAVKDTDYGKMRPQSQNLKTGTYRYYRCRAGDLDRECSQRAVRAEEVENQVVHILKNLKPPDDWRNKMVNSMERLLGDQKLEDRVTQIKEIIERMDFRWDQGFFTDQDEYLEKRIKL